MGIRREVLFFVFDRFRQADSSITRTHGGLIVGVLESAGARVLSASTTREGLVRAAAVRPDVLIADLGLPGEDGYELLAKMRAMFPQIPALALTAYARAADRERVLAAGFEQHVIKPVDPPQLLQLIAAAL